MPNNHSQKDCGTCPDPDMVENIRRALGLNKVIPEVSKEQLSNVVDSGEEVVDDVDVDES